MNIQKYIINAARPFSRYLARILDYSLFYGLFILPLFFAQLFDHDMIHALCLLAIPLLWIPFETLFTSILGTTPGKALFGIHVRDSNEKKLSLWASFKRALLIWVKGLGFNIPVINIILSMIQAVKIHSNGKTSIDESLGTHIYHKKKRSLRTVLSALLLSIFSLFFVGEYELREGLFASKQELFNPKPLKRADHLKWISHKDVNGAYSIEFPGKPVVVEKKMPIPKTKDFLSISTVAYEHEGIEYNLTYTVLPKSWLKWSSGLLLKGAVKLVAAHISHGKILKTSSQKYKQHPSIEFIFMKNNSYESSGRLVLIEDTLYKIEVTYPESKYEEVQEHINLFIQSFEPK